MLEQVAHTQTPSSLLSPNKHIEVLLSPCESTGDASPQWSLKVDRQALLKNCKFSLTCANEGDLFANSKVIQQKQHSVRELVPILFGKAAYANNSYNEKVLTFQTRQGRRVLLSIRCYNDAVAFRYEIPKQKSLESIVVQDEGSTFQFVGNPTAYAQYLENYKTSHEHRVTKTPLHEITRDTLLDMPLTLDCGAGLPFLAITEAALRRYAGMALMQTSTDPKGVLVSRLTPLADGSKVKSTTSLQTPWRVVMLGRKIGDLLESNVLYCLNDPPEKQDFSWIKPGKLTWTWWNGELYDGKPGLPILSLAMVQKYIDFCASNGIAFHSVVADETVTPWYKQSVQGVTPGADTDVTTPRADLDLAGIYRYAKLKGVRLWTWVHQAALKGRVKEAFAAFEKLGWSGMMVDFFDHDDQPTVEFTEEILKEAARHHIMIHFHGIWKPTGMQRTYPNLMNHEGALNLEYLKWSDICTPAHTLSLAFTRLIAGPMDYHLGGFRAVNPEKFQAQNRAPNVLGTRAHQLALYVCLDNPTPMIADYATAYIGQNGFDFLKEVPTYWDETRILSADLATHLVTARRKGRVWYVGGIGGSSSRADQHIEFLLDFLKKGQYKMTLWREGAEVKTDPNALSIETRSVGYQDEFVVSMRADGGFVAKFEPAGQ